MGVEWTGPFAPQGVKACLVDVMRNLLVPPHFSSWTLSLILMDLFPASERSFLPYRRTIPGHPRGMLSRRSSGDDPRLRHLRKRTSFPPSWLHGRDGASSIRSCHRISHSLAYVLRYGARSRSLLAAPRCPVGERFVLLWGEPGTRGPRQISKDLCTGGTNSCPTKQ